VHQDKNTFASPRGTRDPSSFTICASCPICPKDSTSAIGESTKSGRESASQRGRQRRSPLQNTGNIVFVHGCLHSHSASYSAKKETRNLRVVDSQPAREGSPLQNTRDILLIHGCLYSYTASCSKRLKISGSWIHSQAEGASETQPAA